MSLSMGAGASAGAFLPLGCGGLLSLNPLFCALKNTGGDEVVVVHDDAQMTTTKMTSKKSI